MKAMARLSVLPRVVVFGLVVAAVGEMHLRCFPFFPGAIEHGVSSQMVGVIFSLMALASWWLLRWLHAARALVFACADGPAELHCGCGLAFSFGLTSTVADTAMFTACTGTLRFCQGLVTRRSR